MNNQLVSIIVPTFNRADIVHITLDSIVNQSYMDWECIVVDDLSTDNTWEILTSYAALDSRFRLFRNERKKGAQGARNTGLANAKGDFIVFFDSDDVMYPSHLEKKVMFLTQHPEVDIVTSFSHLIDEKDNLSGFFAYDVKMDVERALASDELYIDMNSSMLRRSVLAGYFLDEDIIAYQELDLHLSLSHRVSYATLYEFLTGYYQRRQGTISSDSVRSRIGKLQVLVKHKRIYMAHIGKLEYTFSLLKTASNEMEVVQYLYKLLVDDSILLIAVKYRRLALKILSVVKKIRMILS